MSKLTDENLQEKLANIKDKICCLLFTAEWNPFDAEVNTWSTELHKPEFKDKVAIGKINVENFPLTCLKYSIKNLPSVMLFREGRFLASIIGAHKTEDVLNFVRRYL